MQPIYTGLMEPRLPKGDLVKEAGVRGAGVRGRAAPSRGPAFLLLDVLSCKQSSLEGFTHRAECKLKLISYFLLWFTASE